MIYGPHISAHTVDQIYMEVYPDEPGYKALVFADAAYCLPEFRSDKDKPAPKKEWLEGLTDEEHDRLRTEAEIFFRQALRVWLDEEELTYQIHFPDYESSPYDFFDSFVGNAILRVELSADYLPKGGQVAMSWAEEQGSNLLIDVVSTGEGGKEERRIVQIDRMHEGAPIAIGITVEPFSTEDEVTQVSVEKGSKFQYVRLGFEHIIPKGLDHILFVFGLFLFAPQWRPLLHQSLAFTLSHSVTLILSLTGVIAFQGKWVEVLIALSIVFIAVENIWIKKLEKHRLLIVFLFGLLHGLGFGAVLQEYLPEERIFWPLVGFNCGVELGQIAVLALSFLLFYWFKDHFKWVRITGSSIIALIGAYWVVERIVS